MESATFGEPPNPAEPHLGLNNGNPSLATQLRSDLAVVHQALNLFLNADFAEAAKILEPNVHDSLYRSIGMGLLLFVKSLFTFDDDDIAEASGHLENATRLGYQIKKSTTSSTLYSRLSRIFWRRRAIPSNQPPPSNNPASPTTDNDSAAIIRHADLVIAEAHLLRTILSVITDDDGGWILLVRESLNIRTCYLTYRNAFHQLALSSKQSDPDHQSGILLGIGLINLMFAMLPPRIFQVISFLGYVGSVVTGVSELRAGAACKDGLRAPFCELVLLFFYTILSGSFAVREGEPIDEDKQTRLNSINLILESRLAQFPDSPVYLYFKGRYHFMRKETSLAIATYDQAIKGKEHDWPNLIHACYWDMVLGYMRLLDWTQCHKHAHILANESRWSRAFCTYLEAIFYHAMAKDRESDEVTKAVNHLFSEIPKLQKKIVGRSIPMEKFVAQRARDIVTGHDTLFFPQYELIVIWDNFSYMTPDLLEQAWGEMYPVLGEAKLSPAHRAQLLIMLAAIRRVEKVYDDDQEAGTLQFLEKVLEMKDVLPNEFYGIPLAHLELAIAYLEQGMRKEAQYHYDQASNYPHRYILHKSIQLRLSKFKLDLDRGGFH